MGRSQRPAQPNLRAPSTTMNVKAGQIGSIAQLVFQLALVDVVVLKVDLGLRLVGVVLNLLVADRRCIIPRHLVPYLKDVGPKKLKDRKVAVFRFNRNQASPRVDAPNGSSH
jgi:hypothetical protein